MYGLNKKFKWLVGIAIGFAFWSVIGIYSWGPFFRVRTEYGAVITYLDGNKTVEKNPGMHFRFNSLNPAKWIMKADEQSLRDEFFYLDNNKDPHKMQAADQINFLGAGVWTYKVVDLEKFSIKMSENAKDMLTAELNGIAKARIQSYGIEAIVTTIGDIDKNVLACPSIKELQNRYGVEIRSFKITHAYYPDEMNDKAAEAKGIKIKAEAIKSSGDDIAAYREKIAAGNQALLEKLRAGSGVESEEGRIKALEVLKFLGLYEMLGNRPPGENTIVITGGDAPNMTMPAPKPAPTNRR